MIEMTDIGPALFVTFPLLLAFAFAIGGLIKEWSQRKRDEEKFTREWATEHKRIREWREKKR
tara:strand:- start:98 stop:283 length:186 start_codon:yes stop_codon:yes gene_type:complete